MQQVGKALAQVPAYISRIDEALRTGSRDDILDQADEFRDQAGAAWAMITGPDRCGASLHPFGRDLRRYAGRYRSSSAPLAGAPPPGIWMETTDAERLVLPGGRRAVGGPRRGGLGGAHPGAARSTTRWLSASSGRRRRKLCSSIFDTLGEPRVAASTLPAGTLD